ncbi:MAG: phosphatidylglycerophosphatase A [Candidatus Omnitrophica bacterium]|nr:phosphatidylglycerophosphatase A [Candidatus Omnitrophota bacterium]MCF7892505.1 phosphatidylglycerophosphatase A [Candidatus Omnitrophota bacterium]MCF7895731.1 phosphatidylglycerophosphatase A [Candidatus Omnitrophota bacterium]
MNLKDKIIIGLASLFGIGFIPGCPGTAGSLFGLLFVWLAGNQALFFLITLFSCFLAFLVAGKAEKLLGQKDSKQIVIDELAGILVTFLFVPKIFSFLVVGFFLFRLFDIIKVFPANKLEKKKGSLGIVGDDLIAGVYANLVLQFLRLALNIS